MSNQDLTLNQAFNKVTKDLDSLAKSGKRQDTLEFQQELANIEQEIKRIDLQVENIGLFSDNEFIEELSPNTIKFLGLNYFLAEALNKKVQFVPGSNSEVDYQKRKESLTASIESYVKFLKRLKNYIGVLTPAQERKIENFGNKRVPDFSSITIKDPAMRREDKISNFNLEKQISAEIAKFEKENPGFFDDDETSAASLDDEVVSEMYINQLRLYAMKSFSQIELISMELQVLQNRPTTQPRQEHRESRKEYENSSKDGGKFGVYTEKLEQVPRKGAQHLISKEGKVLQPFTFVSRKDEIASKVYGYGQTMPTMSVEEYIEDEIKKGGIKTEVIKGDEKDEDESSDEDEEDENKVYEDRKWDEFKDEHARGEGNMKGRG